MSQTQQILKYLKKGKSITPVEAYKKFNCFRLGARIWDLKKMGYNIEPTIISDNGKHFAEYRLI